MEGSPDPWVASRAGVGWIDPDWWPWAPPPRPVDAEQHVPDPEDRCDDDAGTVPHEEAA